MQCSGVLHKPSSNTFTLHYTCPRFTSQKKENNQIKTLHQLPVYIQCTY